MYKSCKIFNQITRFVKGQKTKSFHKWNANFVRFSDEISESLSNDAPVVALESTVITHGLPYPDNYSTAVRLEEIVRENKATPATIGVMDGNIHIGMSKKDIQTLASKNQGLTKISRRDLPYIISKRMSGGTTVAATMLIAHKAKIAIFATGGIGGVHRGGENTMDISADLFELARTPMTVVSSGVKSILDIGRTLEYLETLGVCVATFGSSKSFPSFFTPKSKFSAVCNVETSEEAARLINSRDQLSLESGILLAVPIPEQYHEDGYKTESVIKEALDDARVKCISGKDVTPFVLERVRDLSQGASLRANIGLLENNAKVASQIAVQLHNIKRRSYSTGAHFCVLQSPVSSSNRKPQATNKRPVVIGGSVLDIHVKAMEDVIMDGRTVSGAVESNAGGVGRNLADCMTRLELNPFFISVVGGLEHSQALLSKMKHMDTKGIKLLPNTRTAVCIVVLDQYGECLYVIGDMNIHNLITSDIIEEHKKIICNAPLIVMDGNIPKETMCHLLKICSEYNIPVWFEPTDLSTAFKPFESTNWKSAIAYASPNLNELRVMHNAILAKDAPLSFGLKLKTQHLFPLGSKEHLNNILEEALHLGVPLLQGSFHTLVVTLGAHGVLVISNSESGTSFPLGNSSASKGKVRARYYSALIPKTVVSVSGAGDCFASGMIGGLLHGMDLTNCVRVGQQAAILSLASHHAVPDTLNPEHVFNISDPSSMKELLILA